MITDIKVLIRLFILFRPYWGWMLLGIFLSVITLLANVGLLALAAWFITIMGIAGAAGITQVNYFTPAAMIRGFAIIRTAGRYAERVISHEATFRQLSALRVWFYERLEPLAPAVLQKYHSGDILSRISADIDQLQNFYLRIAAPLVVALIAVIFYSIFLLRYDIHLWFAEISLLLLAGVIIPLIVNRRAQKPGKRIILTKNDLRTTAIDSMQGMGELLIYGVEQQQIEKMQQLSQQLVNDQQKHATLTGLSQGAMGLCANLAMWSMLIIAIPLVGSQQLSPEMMPMFALFALASFEAIVPLPLAFQLLPETLVAAKRIFDMADSKPVINEPEQASPQPQQLDIIFDRVRFRYPNSENDAIKSLSFQLRQGENIAIIGESGVGKTSIVQLLLKFWPCSDGTITLGGYDLKEFHSEDCRHYFSVVSQHTVLFNSTIKRNLLLAKLDATDAELEQVCRIAQIHDFIISSA
ncbi:MAG: thiol reductant ABC exporter subunit CydC [Gammaproteobacteria bacterium]|nr:thiol reductant ABC exporter subunit CydC [Gammaproteobacteria bacterium]